MVQALINTLNTPTVTSAISSMSDCNAAKTDFQKLFDKQNAIEEEKTSLSQDIQATSAIVTVESEDTNSDNETETDITINSEEVETSNNNEIETTFGKDIETETETEIETEVLTQTGTQTQTFIGIIQNIVTQFVPTEENNITSNEKLEYKEYTEFEKDTEETTEIQSIGNYNDLDINLNRLEISNTQFKTETPAVTQTKTKDTGNAEAKSIDEIVDEDVLQELNIESVTSECANKEGSSDLMQNQTPQEQGVRAMLQTDADFTEVKSEIKPAEVNQGQEATLTAKASPDKIVEQISKHMEKLYNGSKLEMVLNPESLGKVTIQLINTKEGLSAQFTVATQEARNLIMKGIDGLKDNLLSHGVNVDNVSVKLNDTQESEYNSDWTEQDRSGGENKQQNKKQEQRDKKQFEQTMAFVEEENGKV